MGKIILYQPIVKPVRGCWFHVNGATNQDRDEAIRLTKQHCEFRNGAKIARIDKIEIDEDEYNRKVYF